MRGTFHALRLAVTPPHPTSLCSVDLSPHAGRGERRVCRSASCPDFQTAREANASPPVFLCRPRAGPRPLLLSLPSPKRGEAERRKALKLPRSCEARRAPCDRCARLTALHLRRSHSGAGPRFSFRAAGACALSPGPSASSWRGAVVPPGGAPAPPECVAANHARGRRTGSKAGNCPAPNHRGQGRISGPPPRSAPPAERLRKAPLGERGGRSLR